MSKYTLHNGFRVEVLWPDFAGLIGFQPEGIAVQASYRPNRAGPKPKPDDVRAVPGHGTFRVMMVSRNQFIADMLTLELEKLHD